MSDNRPSRTGKLTIRDVAEDAGVSTAAVSKVLRNAYGVSDKLRENVLESIHRLGYRPSMAARGMRGQTYTIGVLLVEMTNPFLASIIDGIQEVLGQLNYKTMIGAGQAQMQIETSLIDTMMDFRMDGLILVAPRIRSDLLSRYGKQTPLVVIGHHEDSAQDFDTVNSDDQRGARIATEALIARGHTNIHMATLNGDQDSEVDVYRQREMGYASAMTDAGLAGLTKIVKMPLEHDISQTRALLTTQERPSAYFCWSDLLAVDLINQAKCLGIRVPDELAIVGYDNSAVAALPLIDLTSIDQDGTRIGRVAAQTLLARIGGASEAKHILIEPSLVERGSL